MTRQGDVQQYIVPLMRLLDHARPSDALNHPTIHEAMRELVAAAGQLNRPDLATQAFCFGAELERERLISMIQRAPFPVHDREG